MSILMVEDVINQNRFTFGHPSLSSLPVTIEDSIFEWDTVSYQSKDVYVGNKNVGTVVLFGVTWKYLMVRPPLAQCDLVDTGFADAVKACIFLLQEEGYI